MEIVKLAGKTIPVLTRFPDARLGFRMMSQIREVASEARLLRLRSSEGQEVIVGASHVFLGPGGEEIRADSLREGTLLDSGWSYPAGYAIPDADEYATGARGKPWQPSVVIARVEDAGYGSVFGASVSGTKTYFLTFGARSRAQR